MYSQDKNYIQTLADGLKIKDLVKLDSIMGPNELKKLLQKMTMEDYMGDNAWINLHTHSAASDGKQLPGCWLENALKWKQEHGLKNYVIALTDHDTTDGLIPVLKKLVKDPKKYEGLRVVLGCELSTAIMDETTRRPLDFEVLHYALNPFDKKYVAALKNQSRARLSQMPILIKELKTRFPELPISYEDFKKSSFCGLNAQKGLGVNWIFDTRNYAHSKNPQVDMGQIFDFLMEKGADQNRALWRFLPDLMADVKAQKFGLTAMAHPYRLQFNPCVSDDFRFNHPELADSFMQHLFKTLAQHGVDGAELFYGNLHANLDQALDDVWHQKSIQNDAQGWVNIILNRAQQNLNFFTGGNDNHMAFLGTKKQCQQNEAWEQLQKCWKPAQDLIQKGYHVLDKEITLGLPGPCMPAVSDNQDIGIGSPYGLGADRVWDFWGKAVHKILLGPSGRTCRETKHSPYVSDVRPNPFFIPVEKWAQKGWLSDEDLAAFYHLPKEEGKINFEQVEKTFNTLIQKAHKKSKSKKNLDAFVDEQAILYADQNKHPYIADLQVQIPKTIVDKNPDLFLPNFTLGSPADAFSDKARNWGFPVLNPKHLWDKNGLGKGGKLWQDILRQAIKGAKGGLRIDHFIGFVNPYVISSDPNIPNGRLYSSYDHPVLGQFALRDSKDFGKIVEKIVLPVLKEAGLTLKDLYPEDIGARPEQLDGVMERFGLGRLLVAEFKEPQNPNHMYQLMRSNEHDVATLDTHDAPSIFMFFDGLDEGARTAHAKNLANSLRFEYNDSLKSTEQLARMQWGELLTCPAKRVQAFFTSWTGQNGRYNQPGNPVKWQLRCQNDFDQLYFENLSKGRAYNPLDAIALAIYARGDKFYQEHKALVDRLRQKEDELKTCVKSWMMVKDSDKQKSSGINCMQKKMDLSRM